MKRLSISLKILTVVFAIATAVLLSAWVLELVDSEEVKDSLIKVALLTGIAAATTSVVQLITHSKD